MLLPEPAATLAATFPNRNDLALAYLKGQLLDGGLEPGQVFSTEDVAQRLRISRAPATDAIKRLARDGFIAVAPQVGCRVRTPKPAEVADFYRLFARSEALITGFAAARRTESQASSFQALTSSLTQRVRDARNRENPGPKLRSLNRERYEAIHALANSQIAGELVSNMWDRSDFYVRVACGTFVLPRAAQSASTKISKAIVAGDADTASGETESYLSAIGEQTAARLRSQS